MPIILIPLLIILAIAGFSIGGNIFEGVDFGLPSLNTLQERSVLTPEVQTPSGSSSTVTSTVSFILDTEITKEPEDGNNTNTVIFEFSGSIIPEDNVRITYETYIAGIDKYWKPTSSAKRTIKLPLGPNEYTFKVRSKYKGEVDYTPASYTFTINTSEYYGKVDIRSVRQESTTRKLLITLRPNLTSDEKINITGWRIEGELGGFTIPLGIEKIPQAINFTGTNNINLRRGDAVYLTAEKSPFGRNISFRPNICMGYFKQYYTFPLSISSSCPDKPTERDLRYLRIPCQDFILKDISFSSCTIPNHANIPSVATDSECLSYIQDRFNYSACYNLHKNDSDFTKNEWHIYMERDFTRDRHDTIKLLDKDGRIVDTFIY
ncbi:MAG TPA: hypothetical protein ENI04_00910 [Candidatus Wildermuthbacteria bacterium]|nr:hypothetical protein [Candidatus Wildermuthbacteria bacterium]